MGAMLKRRSNILTLFRFFVSAAIADFGPTEVQSGQLKHFLLLQALTGRACSAPSSSLLARHSAAVPNELVQYRDAAASSYPPQSQIPIDPSPPSSDTNNALRSPLLNLAGICSAGIGQQTISAAVASRRFRIPA